MKTVTQLFTDTLGRKVINVKRLVYYKRRYWSGSAYVWEAAWTLLDETKIVSVSPMTSALDTTTQNAFKVSNVTIVLKNFNSEWEVTNLQGKFKGDGVSAIGYEPFWTKFKVTAGLIYDNKTTELVTLFTGVATDFNFNTTAHSAQITVTGMQDLLSRSNAEAVSSTSTLENIGTGNASTTVFFTAQKGVGIVKAVYVAGLLKRPGVDYTLSQLNDPANFGKVTFVTAPATSSAITITYIYWLTLQKVETLITNLCNQANIPGGNQQVTPVSFPNLVTGTHTWNGQSVWETGTIQNVGTRDGTGNLYAPLPYQPANFYTGWVLAGSMGNGGTSLNLNPSPTGGSLYPSGTKQQIGNFAQTGAMPVLVLQQYTAPATVDVLSIALPVWTNDINGATVAIVVYADNGSNLPNYSSNLYTSSGYTTGTYPGSVALSVGTLSFTSGTKYWIGFKRISGTGAITFVYCTQDASAIAVCSDTTTSPTFRNLLLFVSSTGPTYGSQLGMTVSFSFAPYAASGTATSPTYDTGCIGITNTITATFYATIPAGNTVSMAVYGSNDGTTWNFISSSSSFSFTFSSNYRYWRVIFSFASAHVQTGATLWVASPFYLDFGSSGTWISPVLDMTAIPQAFGAMAITDALNIGPGTVAIYTATSSDGITFDAFVAVSGTNVPQSALKRYVQVKVVLTQSPYARYSTPTVASISLVWYQSTILVTLANFTGMTCYDAVTQLATLCNYEFGFDASENFFFRPKNSGATPVLSIDDTNFIVDILSLVGGYDLVYNGVRASYGGYTTEVDDPGTLSTQPTPRFGYALYQPSVSNMLVSADADLATNIAQTLFNFYQNPRKKIKIATKFLPQLDLSDIISVSMGDWSIGPEWFWGDPDHYWGDPTVYYYGADSELLPALTTKVVGQRIDTDNWSCEFDLEEVV